MNINDDIFKWDYYSDQPHVIRNKKIRKYIHKRTLKDTIKTILTNVAILPLILSRYSYALFEEKEQNTNNFFAISVNLDKEPVLSPSLIDELGVEDILIRLPLNDIKNLSEYKKFIEKFPKQNIIVNILQDRTHILDKKLLQRSIFNIFDTLNIKEYQVANAINRKKWGFFTMDEYLSFYQTVQNIRDKYFPDINLIGSSVIDFEYHYTIRTLFNLYKIHYDKFSALLYVDRRGSPLNKQMGFDLIKKIKLLYSIVSLSPKTENKIVITETNWPISKTAPYAPTSEKECVKPDEYALYMVQYYLLALSTGMVEKIYWHQLIAPGYGLIDNRDGIKKYPAFYAFKTMIHFLKDAKLLKFDFSKEIKYMKFEKKDETIEVYWSDSENLDRLKSDRTYSIYGKEYEGEKLIYVINTA